MLFSQSWINLEKYSLQNLSSHLNSSEIRLFFYTFELFFGKYFALGKENKINYMKKILLSIALLIGGFTFGQNVQDQKVSFSYIQLPSNPIAKGISNFNLVTDLSGYVKSNEDSMSVYQNKLSAFEAEFATWLEDKMRVDKLYLMELAKWERAVNATVSPAVAPVMPIKPPYADQPIKEEIKLPLLTEDVTQVQTSGAINLEGYTKGEGGAIVTLSILGFQNASITVKKTGTGAATKYKYTSSCKMPIKVTIEVPGEGIILSETVNDNLQTSDIKTYDNQYEHQVWLIDNYDTFWAERQKTMLAASLKAVNALINDKCAYPKRTRSTEIYTVKKHKGHDYSDLIDAYTNVKSGYDLLFKDVDRKSAIAKIEKGIELWEDALEESYPSENKERVNKKVTALLYANLAEACMWINDFDSADNYLQKAKIAGVLKYKTFAKRLQGVLNGLKARYEANN